MGYQGLHQIRTLFPVLLLQPHLCPPGTFWSTQSAPQLAWLFCRPFVIPLQPLHRTWTVCFFCFPLHWKYPKLMRRLYQSLLDISFTTVPDLRYCRVRDHRNASWKSSSSCYSAVLRKIDSRLKHYYKASWKAAYTSPPWNNSYVHHSEKYIAVLVRSRTRFWFAVISPFLTWLS